LAVQEQEVTIKALLEAGAHFGHQKNRWNPKMRRFIFEERDGLYIIDLSKTMQQLRKAKEVVEEMVTNHRSILFVGTKKQAKSVVRECAEACGEFYVCERWLGGTLTNLSTIRASIKKLEKIEKQMIKNEEGLTKKELSLLQKQLDKLESNLSGIRRMRKIPGLLIVVDPSKEYIAVREAKKLNIPVMALIDTNCDPDPIEHVICCNDDALKSIKLILDSLTQTILDKKHEMKIEIYEKQDDMVEEKKLPLPKETEEIEANEDVADIKLKKQGLEVKESYDD
jgi:small subunit ribosomal protein S2